MSNQCDERTSTTQQSVTTQTHQQHHPNIDHIKCWWALNTIRCWCPEHSQYQNTHLINSMLLRPFGSNERKTIKYVTADDTGEWCIARNNQNEFAPKAMIQYKSSAILKLAWTKRIEFYVSGAKNHNNNNRATERNWSKVRFYFIVTICFCLSNLFDDSRQGHTHERRLHNRFVAEMPNGTILHTQHTYRHTRSVLFFWGTLTVNGIHSTSGIAEIIHLA